MVNMSNELKAKLMKARSAEEVAALLKDGGVDEPTAERIWAELTHKREADGKELSLEELEAVSGGDLHDWAAEGCAATVRPGSWCWTSDQCIVIVESYNNPPLFDTCPECGTYLYEYYKPVNVWEKIPLYYVCKSCGYREFKRYC